MQRYSIEPRARRHVRTCARKCKEKKKIDTRLDASKNVTHKAGDFLGNKIADAATMSNDDRIQKQEPAEEIIIPLEKREEILGKLRNMLWKRSTIKYLNY